MGLLFMLYIYIARVDRINVKTKVKIDQLLFNPQEFFFLLDLTLRIY